MAGGAPIGNTNGTALKDPEERQKAYRSFCQNIADGYPVAAWSYRNGEHKCHWQTMVRYIEENPLEFEVFLKEESHSISYKKWFDRGIKLTDGEMKGNPSPQTWATIMRNMFDWDKDSKSKETFDTTKFKILEQFFKAFSKEPASAPKENNNHSG